MLLNFSASFVCSPHLFFYNLDESFRCAFDSLPPQVSPNIYHSQTFCSDFLYVLSLHSSTDYANMIFIVIFTVEMILKMYSLGMDGYYVSLFNRYDCFVVCSSLIEIVLMAANLLPPIGISVLRCVRLLRVFKATK